MDNNSNNPNWPNDSNTGSNNLPPTDPLSVINPPVTTTDPSLANPAPMPLPATPQPIPASPDPLWPSVTATTPLNTPAVDSWPAPIEPEPTPAAQPASINSTAFSTDPVANTQFPPIPTDPITPPAPQQAAPAAYDIWAPQQPATMPQPDIFNTSATSPINVAPDTNSTLPNASLGAPTAPSFDTTNSTPVDAAIPSSVSTFDQATPGQPASNPFTPVQTPTDPNPTPTADSLYTAPVQQPTTDTNTTPSWVGPATGATTPPLSVDQPTASVQPQTNTVDAPTDLSHLITNNTPQSTPATPSAETLVVPSSNNNLEVPAMPNEATAGKGAPKWLIGVGVGLLLLVAAASAYFIMGIGKPSATTSLPAQVAQEQPKQQIKPPAPVPTPASTQAPVASGSASFGAFQGSAPLASPSSQPQASSAAALLRQRQGK